MSRALSVGFHDVREIRMGSPFNLCRVCLAGDWVPELPDDDWQDRQAWTENGERVVLVRWDTAGNVPGFRLYVLDLAARTVEVSDWNRGCCEELRWDGATRVAWRAFYELTGSYEIEGGNPAGA